MENFYSTLFIIGGDIDLDGDIPWFGLFKPINVVSFITVLGGTGMMLTGYFNPVLTFGISLLMALLVTFLVHRTNNSDTRNYFMKRLEKEFLRFV